MYGCYVGRHFCSHLLCFLFFIRSAQRCANGRVRFEHSLPTNPLELQGIVTLIKNIIDGCKINKKHEAC